MAWRDRHSLAWSFHRNTCAPSSFIPIRVPRVAAAPAGLEWPNAPTLALPEPPEPEAPLGQTMSRRMSGRDFAPVPLELSDLAGVLHAGFGLRRRGSAEQGRLVPSAGALYPLECFVLARRVIGVPAGLYHLALVANRLEFLGPVVPTERELAALFLDHPRIALAATIVVAVAVPARTLAKYGDRGYRYVLLESGHAAQNINLFCAAQGLLCCNLGGFVDRMLAELLGLASDDAFPVYAQAIGETLPHGSKRDFLI